MVLLRSILFFMYEGKRGRKIIERAEGIVNRLLIRQVNCRYTCSTVIYEKGENYVLLHS